MKRRCECGRRALFWTNKDRNPRSDKTHWLCIRCFRILMMRIEVRKWLDM